MTGAPKLPEKPAKPLAFHPFADLFPIMLDTDNVGFKALVDDIKERGQQEPIWLYEGKVLDGRNRATACEWLGREVVTREYTGDDPIGFVISANLHRRHLDASQRAVIAAKLSKLVEVGANQHTKQGTPIGVAAELLNVGRGSIDRAKVVLKSGDPNLIAQVEKGEVTVAAAAEEVKKKRTGHKGGGSPRKAGKRKGRYDKTINYSEVIDAKTATTAYHTLEQHLLEALQDLTRFSSFAHADEYARRTIERLEEKLSELQGEAEESAEEDRLEEEGRKAQVAD